MLISSREKPILDHEKPSQTREKSVEHNEITIPILQITISIMTSETDFEPSLSGQPNPVPFVKTLTGPLR